MKFRTAFFLSCLLAIAGPSIGHAATVNFSFRFTNGEDPVRGLILGLEDDATGRATSVRITSAAFGVGEYVSDFDAPPNSFTVADGALTSFRFESFGRFNDPPAVTCCTLAMSGPTSFNGRPATLATLWDAPEPFLNPGLVFDFVATRLVGDPPPPAPVPLPAPILMLGAALAGLGLIGRRSRWRDRAA